MTISLTIKQLTKETAEAFEQEVLQIPGVLAVDTWKGRARIEILNTSVEHDLRERLVHLGYLDPTPVPKSQKKTICIDGMTCQSCELILEKTLKKLPWVKEADVSVQKGTACITCHDGCAFELDELKAALSPHAQYRVRESHEKRADTQEVIGSKSRPTFAQCVGFFALALFTLSLFSRLGVLGDTVAAASGTTFLAALILGLVAGTSSCLAVSGGLLLSTAARFRARYGDASTYQRMKPVVLFVTGRVVSYGVLGGLIGLLGSALTFSPLVTGGLTLLAAAFMIVMGLEMLQISPKWLRNLLPRMPKSIGKRILDEEGREHWSAPVLLGAATFFIPCGFTQSLQIYALTTGSFFASGLLLAGFALGTAPALLALGWASSALKGKAGVFFFRFAGALVILLGLFNVQNGLTITGNPLTWPAFDAQKNVVDDASPQTAIENGVQVLRMQLTGRAPYYAPSDQLRVKAGMPVRLEIDGPGSGCRSVFQIPKLGVSENVSRDKTIVEFTPEEPGQYAFSCSMGMYPGTLTVSS